MANIKIYGVLVNDTTEGIVTRTDQILDTKRNKKQEDINSELYEVIERFADPTVTYDDYVTKDSDNAVKSKGVYTFVEDATSHMPYVGDDGYVYVWDLELGDYRRTGTNLRGPAGETGGTVHLIFNTTLIKINNLGQMYPNGPFRVRVVKQYGETGLDPFKDGCVKWWINGIENENEPDGWIGWSESGDEEYGEKKGVTSGEDMSDFTITINPDHYDTITFVLYIDKQGTKVFDQQCIFVIRDPAIYKLDLTNENSMVPMSDGDGNVDDAYFETTQAILYHGAEQVPFKDINYAIESSDGVTASLLTEIDEVTGEEVCVGKVSVSDWQASYSVASVKISAEYPKNSGTKFYAIYTITRVSGITIYRLQPSVTNIKKKKDGTYSTDNPDGTDGGIIANVFRVDTTNSGGRTTKVDSFAAEGIIVRYTYNNKVESADDIYTLNTTDEVIPVHGDDLPKTLDGDVSEIDIYVVKDTQELTNLDLFIDHETVPVVEDGDDGIVLYLDNSDCTVNCTAEGKQVGQIWNTQGILMRGVTDLSKDALWDVSMEPANGLSSMPQYSTNPADPPGYLTCAGCIMKDNIDQVKVILSAKYPNNDSGSWFKKAYTITKAKQGKPGESGYKSTVFCRTNKVPDTPQNGPAGGTYEKPVPTHWVTAGGEPIINANGDNIKWSDGIPTDSSESIWASSRYFNTLGENTTSWTQPSQMTDTSTFNIEFTWFDPYIGTPDTEPDKWFDPAEDAQEFQEHSMVYMATQNIQNGEPVMFTDPVTGQETSWTIVRVLGERGESTVRSMIFARSEKQPATPVGGDIENPMPDPNPGADGITWSDGMPSGNFLHPVWTSMRTFSSLEGFGTNWSEPMVIKDVPGYYDVQYSTVYDNPGDPTNNPGNWYDPEDSGVTVEMQMNTWWMAQRWYGIEWSKDGGITPDWSEWDIFKIRGENGKDGSKAITRMRGAWDSVNGKPADIDYGEWILSGTTHKDNITGQIITEEYQDLVYRTTGEVQNCYKCLISHMKSDAYDPGTVEYVWDNKTQTDKSVDGYWMKAEKYTFLATDLLNAKDIVADVITAHQTEILGKISGDWNKSQKEGNKTVFTRVKTQDGKIEFFYRHSESEDWKLSVDIGYDFESESGVLRFYDSDGVTPLYNLGPKGLTASSVQSPYCTEEEYLVWDTLNYNERFGNDYYKCYGVIFSNSEGSNIYNQDTEELKFIAKTTGIAMKESVFNTYSGTLKDTVDPKFRYKKLKTGSYIPQMTLNFWVTDPLTMEPIPYEGKSVGYPQNDPVINFGGNTIGYLALAEPDLRYQNVTFSFKVAGVDSSFGILTNPVHHWICISEIMTDLEDIEGSFSDLEDGESMDIYVGTGNPCFEIIGEKITGDNGNKIVGYIRPKSELPGSEIFNTITSNDYEWYSNYLVFDTSAGSSPLMTLDSCKEVLEAALKLVGNTFYIFCGNIGSEDGNIQKSSETTQSVTIMCGLQMAFFKACRVIGNMPRNVFIMAKQILSCMTTDIFGNELSGYGGVDKVIGYIFPEDKYYKYDSDTGEISLTSLLPNESLSINSPFDRTDYYKLTASGAEFGYFPEDSTNQRAYLMVSPVSSNIGTTEVTNTGDLTGNTYKISFKSQLDSDNNTKIVLVIEPVNYISAFLGEGEHSMPRQYNYNGSTFLNNLNFIYGIKKGHK